MVPMRDGKSMATDVYRPKDTSKKYAAIFSRTPYNFNFWDVKDSAPRDLSAALEAVKRGLAKPIGSYTQMGRIRLGKRSENRMKKVNELVPLAQLNDVVFGGWDIFTENAYEAAKHAQVLEKDLIEALKEPLSKIKPMADRKSVV